MFMLFEILKYLFWDQQNTYSSFNYEDTIDINIENEFIDI